MARVTGSTMTEEVSCILWLVTSLEPGRWRRECKLNLGEGFTFSFYLACVKIFLTSDLGFEGASADVVRTTVFDGNEIVAGSHWGVCDPVALGALHTVHLHLGRPVDGHS